MMMHQRQEQPQVALVHAAQQVRGQAALEYAMTGLERSRHSDVELAKYGLAIMSLSMVVAFTVLPRTARRTQKVRVRRR